MHKLIRSNLARLAICLGLVTPACTLAAADVMFQAGVNRRAIESSGLDSAWLFTRPIFSGQSSPYIIYRSDEISRLMPGDAFLARLDIEFVGTANFIVQWQEMAKYSQVSYRSLHGEIRSNDAASRKLGVFRISMRQDGSEMTGCVQLQDRDYCFVGKNGVGWIS